jgi:hypothetical protein
VSGDIISLDQLVAISDVSVCAEDDMPHGHGYSYGYEKHKLCLSYSLHYIPVEMPFIGLQKSEQACLQYRYKMSVRTTDDKSTLGPHNNIINEREFMGKKSYEYYELDPKTMRYTDEISMSKKLEELISVWELYRVQRSLAPIKREESMS